MLLFLVRSPYPLCGTLHGLKSVVIFELITPVIFYMNLYLKHVPL